MSKVDAWNCIEKLFRIFDKKKKGVLDLDQLVAFVAEVRTMNIIEFDESNVVNEMMKRDAEQISFEEFKQWSNSETAKAAATGETSGGEAAVIEDPFGPATALPDRFQTAQGFTHLAKEQHPCYTTAAHDIGFKKPRDPDMPLKWSGRAGEFTDTFIVNEPGKGLQVNTYVDRGLRTSKTRSNVHEAFDVDW
eukprot:CAMPEP_0196727732 /NCGR_PEP_ID=MMETSP1091-20130531/8644_1 /TAXON_ID=302021 /ORGANISM="Rhodomonas sp., Strain CCMP768" /LENGTH=191 /DNA_ID=CAMNT_0042070389 /DNA_START=11 /DNA_END=586 /DNA_ORIENTATION=-